jgi:hypothetical protein
MRERLEKLEQSIKDELRMEALLLRGSRAFSATVHQAKARRMGRENRDHARILRRHLRELDGGPIGPGRMSRRVMPLGKTSPTEALTEALTLEDNLADCHEENVLRIEDPYLKLFVGILGTSAREDRRILTAMIEAEETGQVPVGADEYEADLELERSDTSEAA